MQAQTIKLNNPFLQGRWFATTFAVNMEKKWSRSKHCVHKEVFQLFPAVPATTSNPPKKSYDQRLSQSTNHRYKRVLPEGKTRPMGLSRAWS